MRFTSFIIIPDRSSRSFTIRIPNIVLTFAGAGLVLGFGIIVVLGIFYNRLFQEASRADVLARDNRNLVKQVDKVVDLDRQIREMRSLDIRVRRLLGQEVDPSIYGLSLSPDEGTGSVEAVEESLKKVIGLGGAARESIPSLWPLTGQGFISKAFSWSDSTDFSGHMGVDITAKIGTPILSSATGRVVFAGIDGDWGNKIAVDHGNGIETIYAHLSELGVTVDVMVAKGDTIGLSGNSGRSSAPHLHYEMKFIGRSIDPQKFLPIGEQSSSRH